MTSWLLVVMASQCWLVLVKKVLQWIPSFADYLTHADLSKYAVINPNSRTISISSADFAALNKEKENAEDPTLNPLAPVTPSTIS